MTQLLQPSDWELALFDLAVPKGPRSLPAHSHLPHAGLDDDRGAASCNAITRRGSKTFYLASSMLPGNKRDAVRALYAFCRTVDDIVDVTDRPSEEVAVHLDAWRTHGYSRPQHNVDVWHRWRGMQHRFAVPHHFADQLIDGVHRDLVQQRYETFNDLATYCYGVACTVGLMVMHIVGFRDRDEAIPYAIRLGTALQLTNILRDVGEDWGRGRVYLPQEELRDFGLSDDDIAAGVATGAVTGRWRAFMQFQIARARQLYEQAMPGIALLERDGRFAIRAASELYCGILRTIEHNGYDVFAKRASLSSREKAAALPGIWWRSR